MRHRAVLGLTLFLLSAASALPPAMAADVTVFAAASLKEALDEQARQFEATTGNKVIISYGASSALAKQVDAGAPADAFISADLDWMDHVDQRGLLMPGTRVDLLRNTLVLIAPASSRATLQDRAWFRPRRRVGPGQARDGQSRQRAAGKYGRGALESWASGAASEGRLRARRTCARRSHWCRAVKQPFGIVYRTDALADKGVKIVDTFPPDSYPPIVYPAAVLAYGKSPAARPLAANTFAPSPRADLGEVRVRVGSISHAGVSAPNELGILALSLRVAIVSVICSLPVAILVAYGLPAALVSRQDAGRRDRPPAAGAAAGRRGLCAAGAVRQARTDRERAR